MQKENLFFFSFPSDSNFLAKRKCYEKTSEMQKENKKKLRYSCILLNFLVPLYLIKNI